MTNSSRKQRNFLYISWEVQNTPVYFVISQTPSVTFFWNCWNFNTKKTKLLILMHLRWFIVSENSPDVCVFSVNFMVRKYGHVIFLKNFKSSAKRSPRESKSRLSNYSFPAFSCHATLQGTRKLFCISSGWFQSDKTFHFTGP